MGNTELTLEIKTYLSTICRKTKSDKLNICAHIYSKLANLSEPSISVEVLRFFYENADNIESSESEKVVVSITEDVAELLQKQYGDIVDALFERLLKSNLQEDQFYQKIWEVIFTNPSFEDDKARIFALYYIWIDVRIPYFHLDEGLTMSEHEFQTLSESMNKSILKARFILRTPMFEQRTTRASAILELLNEYNDERERVVLMAHILSFALPPRLPRQALQELLSKLVAG